MSQEDAQQSNEPTKAVSLDEVYNEVMNSNSGVGNTTDGVNNPSVKGNTPFSSIPGRFAEGITGKMIKDYEKFNGEGLDYSAVSEVFTEWLQTLNDDQLQKVVSAWDSNSPERKLVGIIKSAQKFYDNSSLKEISESGGTREYIKKLRQENRSLKSNQGTASELADAINKRDGAIKEDEVGVSENPFSRYNAFK